jgi:hypothetical protein
MSDQNGSRGRGGGTSDIPSRKLDRMVCHRNRVGRDYLHLLEFDPAVVSYQEYPRTIRYLYGFVEYSYTPDFLVIWRNRSPGIVVTTMQAKVDDPAYQPRWTATRTWCEQHHHEFGMVTESSLLAHRILLANLKQLAVHAFRAIPTQAYDYLMKTVMAGSRPLSIAEIVRKAPHLEARAARSYLWHLLATGDLSADLNEPLNVETTRISWKGVSDYYGISRRFTHEEQLERLLRRPHEQKLVQQDG